MKIIIVGCGKIGTTVAEQLNNEGHEITVIDLNKDKLRSVTDALDIMGVEGNGAASTIQREAGVEDADLLIATTSSDELNMVCCLIARKVGKNCHTIARIRNPEYNSEMHIIREELNLSMQINPELAAAREMARLIKFPSAIKVDTFAKGRVELLAFEIPDGSILHNMQVMDIHNKLHSEVLVCAVERGKDVVIPNGFYTLHEGDKISVVSVSSSILDFLKKIGIESSHIKNVLLVGGGRISYYLAKLLEGSNIKVKIIEKEEERCRILSEQLNHAMILHGNGIDEQLLLEEGLDTVDAFAALTDMDEENIMLSLYAGSFHHAKLMTKIDTVTYEEVISNLELGSIIKPKQITADTIARYVRAVQNSRGSNVQSLVTIANGQAEVLEFRAEKGSPILGVPLQKMHFRDNVLIAAINRFGEIITPGGKDTIEAGDSVIIVTTHTGLEDLKDILD